MKAFCTVHLISFAVLTDIAVAYFPGLYCGMENCYEVLGVTGDTTKSEMAKIYRKLAKKYHPDRVKDPMQKTEAEEKFRQIAAAYETLKDDDTRADYDEMLANPDAYYYHYYKYYRRRVAPKVDVRIVIAVTIAVISLVQYISAYHKFNEALEYLMTQPKYRIKAQEIAKQRGLLVNEKLKGKRRRDKDTDKEDQQKILRNIIAENIDIKGGYKKPSIVNTLFVQLFLLPYTCFVYIKWWLNWTWRFTIKRHDYDEEAKLYKIRKFMKMSEAQFASLSDDEHGGFLDEELWMKDKFENWKKHREYEEKEKLAQSGRYKQYRRYMKNHGPGQISFLDED